MNLRFEADSGTQQIVTQDLYIFLHKSEPAMSGTETSVEA